MELKCPKCSATEVRKLSMIYSEGLSTINTVSHGSGAAFGSGGGAAFGSHSSHTRGHQQTMLSKKAAPPTKKHWILMSIVTLILGIGVVTSFPHPGFGTLLAAGIAVLAGTFAVKWKQYNGNVRPGLLQRWEQSFMCNRCGEMFIAA